MECDRIVVKSINTIHEVATFRAAKLSRDFYGMREEMERKRTVASMKDLTRDPTLLSTSKCIVGWCSFIENP